MHSANETTPLAQSLAGWHERSHPLAPELAATFIPNRADLKFAVRISAMRSNTIILALFQPNIAMDCTGTLLELSLPDFEGLTSLAEKVDEISSTASGGRLGWRIAHSFTCRPFYILQIPNHSAEKPYSSTETSVYGYYKGMRRLSHPVGNIMELPEVVQEFFALAGEENPDYKRRGGENKGVYYAVTQIVQEGRIRGDHEL